MADVTTNLAQFLAGIIAAGRFTVGAGDPDGVVVAPIGSIYLRTDGGALTSIYVKESGTGSSGWVGK